MLKELKQHIHSILDTCMAVRPWAGLNLKWHLPLPVSRRFEIFPYHYVHARTMVICV